MQLNGLIALVNPSSRMGSDMPKFILFTLSNTRRYESLFVTAMAGRMPARNIAQSNMILRKIK